MDGSREPDEIAAHVAAISGRTHLDAERMAQAFVRRSWPGGVGDRLDRAAVEWLRRWAPTTVKGVRLDCSCAAGRCSVCN